MELLKGIRSIFIKALVCIMIISSLAACQSGNNSKQTSTSVNAVTSSPKSSTEITSTGSGQTIDQKVSDLLAKMTLDEKVGQMMQPTRDRLPASDIKKYFIGSVLSGGGSHPGNNTKEDWIQMCTDYQNAAKSTRLGIPIIYGIDAVHGHNTIYGAVVFPQNIGLGAAQDPELMTEIGNVTAQEMITSGVNWDFGPCIAVARDERWGRTYESYSESPDIVSSMCAPFIKALQANGITACAKHYVADGGAMFGVAGNKYPIDQGNAVISEDELRKIHLPGYEAAIKAGAKTIMASFSSWNGVKMHENKYLITDVLKGELGFKGFVVSDYEAVHQLKEGNLSNQVIACINSGVDMLMEPNHWKEIIGIIKDAVNSGKISKARLDDAVARILKVKFEMGLFENPLGDQKLAAGDFGEEKNREVAQKAVRESLVLLKNQKNVLPLKKNAKIFVAGPAANNVGIQCGGWTKTWQGGMDKNGSKWMEGTTILEGFQNMAKENGGTIITDPNKAKDADVTVLVIGEKPYAEYEGDDSKLDLYNGMALPENKKAIDEAKAAGKPIVTILISGRPRIVTNEINSWDAFVAAWLPGTEGAAITDVLYGDYDFTGKLSFTWPKSVGQLPINVDAMNGKDPLFPFGFGLKMKK
ncbi:MAG: glycoside hydrolase family 3 N-terminal domain-containing protein [Bacillota bacterium]|nr:glycoside hydrolase family 3 N-terminal domain-containing protein [Bacillota bacterium]